MPTINAATIATTKTPASEVDDAARRNAMRAASREFEAVFITQMLEHSGLGDTPSIMGGGAGEEGFKGMLLAEQGRLMTDAGGIGLADEIYRSLLRAENMSEDSSNDAK